MPLSFMSAWYIRSSFSPKLSSSMVVAMKFTRKVKSSMERRAVTASFGVKEEDLSITAAFSLRDSAIILALLSEESTLFSCSTTTWPLRYGSMAVSSSRRTLAMPWSTADTVPSGMSKVFIIFATVPKAARSSR